MPSKSREVIEAQQKRMAADREYLTKMGAIMSPPNPIESFAPPASPSPVPVASTPPPVVTSIPTPPAVMTGEAIVSQMGAPLPLPTPPASVPAETSNVASGATVVERKRGRPKGSTKAKKLAASVEPIASTVLPVALSGASIVSQMGAPSSVPPPAPVVTTISPEQAEASSAVLYPNSHADLDAMTDDQLKAFAERTLVFKKHPFQGTTMPEFREEIRQFMTAHKKLPLRPGDIVQVPAGQITKPVIQMQDIAAMGQAQLITIAHDLGVPIPVGATVDQQREAINKQIAAIPPITPSKPGRRRKPTTEETDIALLEGEIEDYIKQAAEIGGIVGGEFVPNTAVKETFETREDAGHRSIGNTERGLISRFLPDPSDADRIPISQACLPPTIKKELLKTLKDDIMKSMDDIKEGKLVAQNKQSIVKRLFVLASSMKKIQTCDPKDSAKIITEVSNYPNLVAGELKAKGLPVSYEGLLKAMEMTERKIKKEKGIRRNVSKKKAFLSRKRKYLAEGLSDLEAGQRALDDTPDFSIDSFIHDKLFSTISAKLLGLVYDGTPSKDQEYASPCGLKMDVGGKEPLDVILKALDKLAFFGSKMDWEAFYLNGNPEVEEGQTFHRLHPKDWPGCIAEIYADKETVTDEEIKKVHADHKLGMDEVTVKGMSKQGYYLNEAEHGTKGTEGEKTNPA